MRRTLFIAAAALLSVTASPVLAGTPQRTTATYDDWTLRCAFQGKDKHCEIAQSMQIKGQSRPITQVAIGRQGKSDPMRIVFEVPVNVWLADGVELATADKKLNVKASFTRCLPVGCFAEAEISADEIKGLRALKKNGKLQFKDGGRQVVAIPVSFKGFGAAYDAMQKQ